MRETLGDLAEKRAQAKADCDMRDVLDALVDVDRKEGAPAPLLYAMQSATSQAVRVRIGDHDVAIALAGASDASPDEVWAAIQQLAS